MFHLLTMMVIYKRLGKKYQHGKNGLKVEDISETQNHSGGGTEKILIEYTNHKNRF